MRGFIDPFVDGGAGSGIRVFHEQILHPLEVKQARTIEIIVQTPDRHRGEFWVHGLGVFHGNLVVVIWGQQTHWCIASCTLGGDGYLIKLPRLQALVVDLQDSI